MVNGKIPKQVWDLMRSESDQALGDRFWEDIFGLMPNLGPRIDVFQTDMHVVVIVELPGLDSPKYVNMKLKNSSTVLIKGEIPCDYPVDEGDVCQSERFFGGFQRKIPLPHDVTAEQVHSIFHNGLLIVHFMKKPTTGEEHIPLVPLNE